MKQFLKNHFDWLCSLFGCFILSIMLCASVVLAPACLSDPDLLQNAFSLGLSCDQIPGFFLIVGLIDGLLLDAVAILGKKILLWMSNKCKKSPDPVD